MIQLVLSIETSCDDTSVALVRHDGRVLSCVSANQDLAHAPFGGIVPEIACRNHTFHLLPLVQQALQKASLSMNDLQGIIVTNRPGLIGSLIVGVITAKTLAQSLQLPILGVNHLEGHLLAPFLKDDQYAPPSDFQYPYLGLAVSGGHTSLYHIHHFGKYEVLGRSVDDAAGEAFDKFAKMLGLGFPGGVQVDRWACQGNPSAYVFPRSMIHEENYLMSFSGLKSSAQRLLQSMSQEEIQSQLADLCASFQEAIVDVLLHKLDRAVQQTGLRRAIITGGVSANSRLRKKAEDWASQKKIQLVVPPLRYCTDNAAMIGYAGICRMNSLQQVDNMSLAPSPRSLPGDFQERGLS